MDNGYEMSNQYKPRLIKLSNNTPFSCRFFCNNKLIATTNQQNKHTFTINLLQPNFLKSRKYKIFRNNNNRRP